MISLVFEGNKLAQSVFMNIVSDTNDRKKLIKEVILPAAKILKKVMIEKAPQLKTPVFNVYRTPKLSGKMKAPKGMGVIYAAIASGTLKRSISYFGTRATRKAGALNVGPRYKIGVWKKPTKGGWFMHFVQFGTDTVTPQPFVYQAFLATKSGVGNLLSNGMNRRLRQVVKKDGKGIVEYIG